MGLLVAYIWCWLILKAISEFNPINSQPTVADYKLIRTNLTVSRRLSDTADDLVEDFRFKQIFVTTEGQTRNVSSSSTDLLRVEMLNVHSMNFIININIGEPTQPFKVLIDTGSSLLWVPSISCKTKECLMRNTYDCSKSNTYKPDGRKVLLGYADGHGVGGHLSIDRLEISGISLEDQTFLEVEHLSGPTMDVPVMDGIFGLELDSSSANRDLSSPMKRLVEQEVISEPMVSFSLNHQANSLDAGEMIIGGLARDRYFGQVTWAPTIHQAGWRFRLDSIRLDHNQRNFDWSSTLNSQTLVRICQDGCQASPDTGTLVIVGDSNDVNLLNEKLGAIQVGNGFSMFKSCDLYQLPDLIFTISGEDFTLTPNKYILRTNEGCMSGLRAHDTDHWILGGLFLANHYSVFDYGRRRVGFAQPAAQL